LREKEEERNKKGDARSGRKRRDETREQAGDRKSAEGRRGQREKERKRRGRWRWMRNVGICGMSKNGTEAKPSRSTQHRTY
jgi:hypothetical protein